MTQSYSTRNYVADLARTAQCFSSAEPSFIRYLVARVMERINEGRSVDSDEYRALLRLAGAAREDAA
jgi:hypothetical protein